MAYYKARRVTSADINGGQGPGSIERVRFLPIEIENGRAVRGSGTFIRTEDKDLISRMEESSLFGSAYWRCDEEDPVLVAKNLSAANAENVRLRKELAKANGAAPAPKRRGRPRKVKVEENAPSSTEGNSD